MGVQRLLDKYCTPGSLPKDTAAAEDTEKADDVRGQGGDDTVTRRRLERGGRSGRPDRPGVPDMDEAVFTGEISISVDNYARLSLEGIPAPWEAPFLESFMFINPAWRRGKRRGVLEPPEKFLRAYFTDDSGRVCVPAASLRWVVDFFHARKAPVHISDKTVPVPMSRPVCLAAGFDGVVHRQAHTHLSEKRYGILRAPRDAALLVAAGIIAGRGERTLIVVKRKKQLYRWREALLRATDLTKADIGLIGDRHAAPAAPVVVGIDRSVYKHLPEISAGHLIIDRCDVVNIKIFYQIAAQRPWRYIMGICRREKREDGLSQMMRAFCGPVRYCVDQDAPQGGKPPVLSTTPTTTTYDPKVDDYGEVLGHLVDDDNRTRQVARDILAAAATGQTVLVVVARTAHIDAIGTILTAQTRDYQVITGRTPEAARRDIAANIAAASGGILLTTHKTVGDVDIAGVDVAVVAAPFRYKDTAAAIVSRVTPGGVIMEYADAHPFFTAALKSRTETYRDFGVAIPPPGA